VACRLRRALLRTLPGSWAAVWGWTVGLRSHTRHRWAQSLRRYHRLRQAAAAVAMGGTRGRPVLVVVVGVAGGVQAAVAPGVGGGQTWLHRRNLLQASKCSPIMSAPQLRPHPHHHRGSRVQGFRLCSPGQWPPQHGVDKACQLLRDQTYSQCELWHSCVMSRQIDIANHLVLMPVFHMCIRRDLLHGLSSYPLHKTN
jgi:hypothetical protein